MQRGVAEWMREHIVPPVRNICILLFCALACDSIDEASWGVMVATKWWLCILLFSVLCKHYSYLDLAGPHSWTCNEDGTRRHCDTWLARPGSTTLSGSEKCNILDAA